MRELCPRVFLISNKIRKWSCLALYFKEVELRKTTSKIENLKNMWCNFDHITLEGKKIQFTKIKIKTNISISNNINVSNNINININIININKSTSTSTSTSLKHSKLDLLLTKTWLTAEIGLKSPELSLLKRKSL